VVANHPSDSNKMKLLVVLNRAGYWAGDLHSDFGAQWLKQVVQLMTKELPSTMVSPHYCSVIYNNYGEHLYRLKHHAEGTAQGPFYLMHTGQGGSIKVYF
jgi:hypothetical protein